MSETKYLTPKEVAEILNVHVNTILNFIREGKLKAYRFGDQYRIDRDEFEVYLQQNRVTPKAV